MEVAMGIKIDLTDMRFERLVARKPIEKADNNTNRETYWLCECDCGNFCEVTTTRLRSGHTKSCGCLREQSHRKYNNDRSKHKRLYGIWKGIKTRCFNQNSNEYCDYGGRGITMCKEWRNDFQAFYYWAISNGYEDRLTIDRIDTNGNYEPSNCRWATAKEQANNTRKNLLFQINNEVLTMANISEKYKIPYQRLWQMNRKLGKEEVEKYVEKIIENGG